MSPGKPGPIAQRILDLLKQKDMSKIELGREIKVSQESMRKWWRGITKPTLENLEKIAGALGVEISDLVDDAKRNARNANEEAIEKYILEDGQDLDSTQREQLRLCTQWLPYDKRVITPSEIHEFANIIRSKKRRDDASARGAIRSRPA